MKILHVTDMHFGPYHWSADNNLLLERINEFDADIVLNTGDMTTDSLDDEFQQASEFLGKIKCDNIVSIMGNHDKFSKRSKEFFRKYIYNGEFVEPKDKAKTKKPNMYLNQKFVNMDYLLYDANFVRLFDINGERVLFIALDSCVMNEHDGLVEEEILHAMSDIIESTPHDRIFMTTHHSVLTTNDMPLINNGRVTDFIVKHKIEINFCGHTHEMDMLEVKDLVTGISYRQYMSSSMSGLMLGREVNMYCTYENVGMENEKITIVRMYPDGKKITFKETVL